MTLSPGSRWVPVYVAATVIAWLAFLSVAGAYCPTMPPAGGLRVHIAPSGVCQLKAMATFWMFLCAMSLAGIPMIKRMGWRGRLFYGVAVLSPTLFVALRNVI